MTDIAQNQQNGAGLDAGLAGDGNAATSENSADLTNNAAAPNEQAGGRAFSAIGQGMGRILRANNLNIRSADMVMPAAIIAILGLMLLPVPTWLLDFSLTISLSFSLLILLAVVFVSHPVKLASFPQILLIAAMIRLGLNVASTRLILSDGHMGEDAAGKIIEAFGRFMAGGNYLIGIIVFSILVIINFIVITKGAGRIAEVTARFTLDGLPGKQMAIDADLSAGLINEEQARQRRKDIEKESRFFGSMDGASKFVRGDAIAGLLITVINIVGGIIIGVLQNDMPLRLAAENYTLLTIGDGLVSQIPALIVSTAAGLLATKSGSLDDKIQDSTVVKEIASSFKSLAIAGFVIFMMGFVPGIPAIPFILISAIIGAAAYYVYKTERKNLEIEAFEKQEKIQDDENVVVKDEPISASLQIDLVRVELGYSLLGIINEGDNKLTDQIKGLRRQLASEFGFVMPAVRIQDNLELPGNSYVIRVKEIEEGKSSLRPNMLMAINSEGNGERPDISGEPTKEPTYGFEAVWINEKDREEATFRGYTVVDSSTVLATHLNEILKDNMADLLSFAETQKLLDELPDNQRKLVETFIPSPLSVGTVQRVLQRLLQERVSIRDLSTILEGLTEVISVTQHVAVLTEHVRTRLARQICNQYIDDQGVLQLIFLSPTWEQAFSENLQQKGDYHDLTLPPSQIKEFSDKVGAVFDELDGKGEVAVLVTSPTIRPFVRGILQRFRPETAVLSQNEIHQKFKLQTLGEI